MIYPKISIVTPSYNQGQYIEQTILSVINQRYPNLEYIIIDGGSTDNTVEIIKKYEHKITYWVSEKDDGQSDALNKGLAKCSGEIFNWINSDDYLEEESLFKIGTYFYNNPTTVALCGWCSYFGENQFKEKIVYRSALFDTIEETLVQQHINQPATFYKLDVVKKLGQINMSFHYIMDLDLWFRFLVQFGQKNILLVDDMFAHFRLHDDSKTVQFQEKFKEDEKLLWHKLLSSLKVEKSITDFFETQRKYPENIIWQFNNISKATLIKQISKKYLFEFYKTNNYEAAKIAFWNQLKAGNLFFRRIYIYMFYNLFVNPFTKK